jgi:hypothetical protein
VDTSALPALFYTFSLFSPLLSLVSFTFSTAAIPKSIAEISFAEGLPEFAILNPWF